MGTCTERFPAWSIICVLFPLLISIPVSLSQSEGRAKGQCVDGIYRHEDRDCCKCGIGLKVVEHCESNLQHGKCEPCETGTFSSHPNSETNCDSCRSCNHTNENLEEEESCEVFRNAKCRCKQDHYCVSSTDICRLCHPCKKCGAEGIKVQCAGNINTVCNEVIKDESNAGMIIGIIIGVLVVIAILAGLYHWKRKPPTGGARTPNVSQGSRQQEGEQHTIGGAVTGELQPLYDVEFQRVIPDIATAVGWKDMRNVAMRSGLPKTKIENCELDHRGDREEQTIQLLQIWSEEMGRGAQRNLVNILEQSGKKAKAERVTEILKNAAANIA